MFIVVQKGVVFTAEGRILAVFTQRGLATQFLKDVGIDPLGVDIVETDLDEIRSKLKGHGITEYSVDPEMTPGVGGLVVSHPLYD